MDGGVGGGLFSPSPPLHLSFIHPLAAVFIALAVFTLHLICTLTHLGSHFPSLLSPSLFSYLFHPFLSLKLHPPHPPFIVCSVALSYPPLPRPPRHPIDR